MKDLKRKYHIPIYGGWLNIIFTKGSVAKASKKHLKFYRDDLKNYDAFTVNEKDLRPKGKTIYHIILQSNIGPGEIAHEALHTASRIWEDIGDNHDRDNGEEAFAYMLGWIVEKIHKVKRKFENRK